MITIAFALLPNGCDVIASLPQIPPLATRGCHLPPENACHICTFAQAAGGLHFCTSIALSPPRELPHPGLEAQDGEERIGGVDFATGVGLEQGDDAWTGEDPGGVEPAGMGELA